MRTSPTAAPSCAIWRRCARSAGWLYAKPPFGGPEAVLAYLSRYTHRVAISNSRLIAFDETRRHLPLQGLSRRRPRDRQQVMTLAADEFIRRFLLHVLPRGFHRIRHYGLLASAARKANLALARELLDVAAPPDDDLPGERTTSRPPCPCCGGRMIVIEIVRNRRSSRAGPPHADGDELGGLARAQTSCCMVQASARRRCALRQCWTSRVHGGNSPPVGGSRGAGGRSGWPVKPSRLRDAAALRLEPTSAFPSTSRAAIADIEAADQNPAKATRSVFRQVPA